MVGIGGTKILVRVKGAAKFGQFAAVGSNFVIAEFFTGRRLDAGRRCFGLSHGRPEIIIPKTSRLAPIFFSGLNMVFSSVL